MFRPSNPKNVPMRPLNKGVVLNRPSQTLEPSMCIDAKNYIITENGPKRRPGYEPYGGVEAGYEGLVQSPYRHIDLFTFWTSDTEAEEQQLLLITAGPLYKVGIGGLSEVEWTYEEGTITIAGDLVTGAGVDFELADIYPGDLVRCGGGEARVAEIVSDTVIEVDDASDLPTGAGLSYSIQRSFNTDDEYLTDFVVHDNEVIFADYNAPLTVYNFDAAEGSQLSMFIDNDYYRIDNGSGPEDFIARCLAVFKDRLYVGNLIEASEGIKRQRIRWSSATNTRDFSEATAYIDLPYTQGSIVRIVPLENLLVVYLTDCLYVGSPTNNPFLPVTFQKIEMSGVGLVGMKAITSFIGGHFFVGQNDIYMMTSRGPEAIGSTVVDRTIKKSEYRERIYAAPDAENDRIVFGFTKGRAIMSELWSFNYRSRAWSYTNFETYMIANPLLVLKITWESLAGFTWSDLNPLGATFPSWDSMSLSESSLRLFVENNGYLRQLSQNSGTDKVRDGEGGTREDSIEAVYETGDFDFEQPDRIKSFLRLSLKVDFSIMPSHSVNFAVQASWNRGRSWVHLGSLIVKENYDEGYLNFAISSSHVRFRITTTSNVAPFVVSEIVLKVRARGEELELGVQAP